MPDAQESPSTTLKAITAGMTVNEPAQFVFSLHSLPIFSPPSPWQAQNIMSLYQAHDCRHLH